MCSDDRIFTFAGIDTPKSGSYKMCFCDASDGRSCNKIEDYRSEVGKLHVSGVSCLLNQPELVNGDCVQMGSDLNSTNHGGMRCYPKGQEV